MRTAGKLAKPGLVLADLGIDLAVRALEIGIAHDGLAPVAGAGDVDHVEVIFHDDAVQVRVDEVLAGGRAPVSQQHALHIGERQRPLQQRIVVEIDLADRQIVRRAPIGVDLAQTFRGKSLSLHARLPRHLQQPPGSLRNRFHCVFGRSHLSLSLLFQALPSNNPKNQKEYRR